MLAENPLLGRKTIRNSSIRKLLITKYNLLYYEIKGNQIALVAIFFTAQDPGKNKWE